MIRSLAKQNGLKAALIRIKKHTAEKIRKELKISREIRLLITRENFASLVEGVCEIDKRQLRKLAINCNPETGKVRIEFYYEKIAGSKK